MLITITEDDPHKHCGGTALCPLLNIYVSYTVSPLSLRGFYMVLRDDLSVVSFVLSKNEVVILPRDGTKNLIPINKRTKDEQKNITKIGGIKSGEVRREKKTVGQITRLILDADVEGDPKGLLMGMGVPETDANMRAALIATVAKEGLEGNIKATEYLIGLDEKNQAVIEHSSAYAGLPGRVLGSAYVDINRSIDNRRYRFFDFKGGRGSLKSSFCAMKLVDILMLNDSFCAMAVRQVKDTMKDSVYAQIVWAIDELGLTEEFYCTKSPLQIKRKSTGQIIYFRGADDPMKIKSIRPPKGMHIGVLWIEEADQLHGKEALRSILQSVMRGGDDVLVFRSYNTPISRTHYINAEALEKRENRIIHHSYYYQAPKEWLGEPFFDEAEYLKKLNERAYRHEYLGEAVGNGGSVFENVKTRTITDEEVRGFDRVYCGLDWGYYPDPMAFVVCYYNAAQRKLYIFDEEKRFKTGNTELASILRRWQGERIIADSSEPKSIDDMRRFGYKIQGATKGPGSIEHGIKWLASLNEIVIDERRCPHAAAEFLAYEYERTKEDEIISGYPDKNNHFIDAVRYALETVTMGARMSFLK